ncbi:hypothetical protein BM221_001179 [Beauveria bassiana]|uniref:Uncharacterized protein n=1 Tax=Beauveria bassiana TaxID=176275 RepID=A0A2N6P2K8_BEABA|nr:hypothetical protein BM221_001179 [Beauveria bassiana]
MQNLNKEKTKRAAEIGVRRTLLLVLLGGLAVHHVVESGRALHEVVETTHDGKDTERENPDTDNGNNGGLAVLEPSKDTEESGNDIDNQNGARQLPRGNGRPERSVGTGDEDEPVLSEGDFEEENLINVTEVLDDTTVAVVGKHSGEGNPGTDSQDNTKENGHAPELGQVPLDGGLGEGGVVVGNGKSGNIGENSNEDDKLNVQGLGDTVDNVGVHAVENLAGSLEGINDGTETGGKEDNIGGGSGSIRGTLDGDTSIGLLQRGGIVDTVTSHGNEVTTLLENLDDRVLVLGEDLGETISSLDEIVDLRARHVTTTTETKTLGVVDVGTETELAGSFTSDTDGVTSKHLDGETETLGLIDSAGGIVTRGVRAGHDSEDFPSTLTTLASNTKRTETTGSKFSDTVLVSLVNLLGDGVVLLDGLENEKRGTLDTDDALTLRRLNNSLDLLGDGIEGVEIENLVLGEDRLGAGVELEGLEESLVNGVNTLLLAGSSQAGSEHQVIGVNALDGEGLSERELVLGQGTGLVRAENLDTSKRLNGRKLLDNGLLLGEVGSTDGHGGGDDSGKTDGDTNNGNGEGEAKNHDNVVGAVEGRNPDDEKSQNNENQQNRTNAVENLGKVTSATSGLGNEGSGATDEGVVTSGGDDDESLTTLDGGRSVAVVALVLVNSKGLTSDGGLINLEESIFGDNATVGGDNGTFLNLEDVTGNDFGGLNLLEGTVTENDSLESKGLLEFLDNGTSLEFLNETDSSVEQQKGANDTEIDPVLKTSSENSGSL